MKGKSLLAASAAIIMILVITVTTAAQYTGYGWATFYQIQNTGAGPTNITIQYYDTNGNEVVAARKTYTDVGVGKSVSVAQSAVEDPNLGPGRYSVVISAGEPVAAILNQQLLPNGSTSFNTQPPHSTYSGADTGSLQVTLPNVMYNWYNYYTEIFIMNVGSGNATNVDVAYTPGKIDACTTGKTGEADNNQAIPQYASITLSQQFKSVLGAPSAAGCASYTGRFSGSATITSDQPIVAVVNQHNPSEWKLSSYNGFASSDTTVFVPTYMRGYFNYFSVVMITNPSPSATANVQITYNPTTTPVDYNILTAGTVGPVTASFSIPPNSSVTRNEGTPIDSYSDLEDPETGRAYSRFIGSAKVTSNIPVMVLINVEARNPSGSVRQFGAFNGPNLSDASLNMAFPVVLADYYSFYTNIAVQNTTGVAGSCTITYYSDAVNSAQPNKSKAYVHPLPANGSFSVYEGRSGGLEVGDINHDVFWRNGANRRFIGSALMTCTQPVVAFTNEENTFGGRDNLYSFNAVKK